MENKNENMKTFLILSVFVLFIMVIIRINEKEYEENLRRDIEDFSREIKYTPKWNENFKDTFHFDEDTFSFDSELDGFTPEDLDLDPTDPEVEEWYDFNKD